MKSVAATLALFTCVNYSLSVSHDLSANICLTYFHISEISIKPFREFTVVTSVVGIKYFDQRKATNFLWADNQVSSTSRDLLKEFIYTGDCINLAINEAILGLNGSNSNINYYFNNTTSNAAKIATLIL